MKIMLLTETLLPGGAEAFVVRLANALASHHDVSLVAMHGELIHPALREKLCGGVRLDAICLPAKPLLWKVDSTLRRLGIKASPVHYLAARRFAALVRRDMPDIIHSHLLHADRLASEAVVSPLQAIAHVMTVHGDYAPYKNGESDPQLLDFDGQAARIVAGASAIVGVAGEHLRFFEDHFPASQGKLHLIYNGYAASPPARPVSREELGLPPDAFLFGMVSRGVEKKGWAEAVAAFQSLETKNAALVLVGEGPAIERIRRETRDDRIIVAGFSANPLDFVRHFDVGLLPTLFPHESLPTAIVEYLACGKPVIATSVGEIPMMLADGRGREAGLLLDFNGSNIAVDELASKMAALLEDTTLRCRLGDAARSAFARFDMARCTASYLKIYDQLADNGRLAARVQQALDER